MLFNAYPDLTELSYGLSFHHLAFRLNSLALGRNTHNADKFILVDKGDLSIPVGILTTFPSLIKFD
jgi:hypothetical protein